MADFAIIQTGNKQYKVEEGNKIEIELLDKKEGEEVTFDTLLINKKGKISIGTPSLKTSVTGTVVKESVKGEKIHVRTFKAKSRHRRHIGHRQQYTLVEIKTI